MFLAMFDVMRNYDKLPHTIYDVSRNYDDFFFFSAFQCFLPC